MTGLVITTNIGVYPRSTVAVEGEWLSNMFPTTAPIAFLAVFQLGLVLLARPALNRWLQRPLWIIVPALVPAPIVKLFWPIENRSRAM